MKHSPVTEGRIRNRGAVDAVFGGWSSFHDCLLLALRLDSELEAAPALEIDVLAPRSYEQRGGVYHGIDHHCVTLRFHGVRDVVIADFLSYNLIGELKLAFVESDQPTTSPLRVELEANPGYGGEFALQCDDVEVVRVAERQSTVALKLTGDAIDSGASAAGS